MFYVILEIVLKEAQASMPQKTCVKDETMR